MRITIVSVVPFAGEGAPRPGKVLVEASSAYSDRFTRIVTIGCGTASDHIGGSADCRIPVASIAGGSADFVGRLNEAAVELLAGSGDHTGVRTIVSRPSLSVSNPHAPYGDQACSVMESGSEAPAVALPDAGTGASDGVSRVGDLITAAAPHATISRPARQAPAETAGRNPRS